MSMVLKQDSLLLIFVKHPIKGQVKTRLAKGIGEEKALSVYQALLAYTAEMVQDVQADKVVFYGNQLPERDLWSEAGYARYLQEGPDLGVRMAQAFQWGFQQGYTKIQIIGSDNPDLTTHIIEEGYAALDTSAVSLGPAEDGGYYLLGMKTFIPSLFVQKQWSTETVLEATVNDLVEAQLSYHLLPTLNDVDTLEDLAGTFLVSLLS